jgi:hypothetical protein
LLLRPVVIGARHLIDAVVTAKVERGRFHLPCEPDQALQAEQRMIDEPMPELEWVAVEVRSKLIFVELQVVMVVEH